MNTAAAVAAEIAAEIAAEEVTGRDILVRSEDAGRARRTATRLGAVETTSRPSALFGRHVITVWMD
jgi:hypothetical protein